MGEQSKTPIDGIMTMRFPCEQVTQECASQAWRLSASDALDHLKQEGESMCCPVCGSSCDLDFIRVQWTRGTVTREFPASILLSLPR